MKKNLNQEIGMQFLSSFNDFDVINLSIPKSKTGQVTEVIEKVLSLSGFVVRTTLPAQEVGNDEEYVDIDSVFPEEHTGILLYGLRVKEDLTQKELAQRLNITQSRVSDIEKGKKPISIDLAKKIAKEFHTNYRVFL